MYQDEGQLTAQQNVLLVTMKKETDRYGDLTERAKNGAKKGTGLSAMLLHASFGVGKSKVKECIFKSVMKMKGMARWSVKSGAMPVRR